MRKTSCELAPAGASAASPVARLLAASSFSATKRVLRETFDAVERSRRPRAWRPRPMVFSMPGMYWSRSSTPSCFLYSTTPQRSRLFSNVVLRQAFRALPERYARAGNSPGLIDELTERFGVPETWSRMHVQTSGRSCLGFPRVPAGRAAEPLRRGKRRPRLPGRARSRAGGRLSAGASFPIDLLWSGTLRSACAGRRAT
jgi:hypothetical protein